MSVSAHPLLALVDVHKNDLKCSLTNYINLKVESEFGQLSNRIVAMIESGEIVLNAPVSTQANQHLSTDQITCPPTRPAQPITTEPLINRECLDTNEARNAQAPIEEFDCVKEEYDDDDNDEDDEGEYMSDCDEECEDCAKGICQSNQSQNVMNSAPKGNEQIEDCVKREFKEEEEDGDANEVDNANEGDEADDVNGMNNPNGHAATDIDTLFDRSMRDEELAEPTRANLGLMPISNEAQSNLTNREEENEVLVDDDDEDEVSSRHVKRPRIDSTRANGAQTEVSSQATDEAQSNQGRSHEEGDRMGSGQLRNRIVAMIESGEIVRNAPVSTQANTNQANSTEDDEYVVDSESHHQIDPQQHIEGNASASVQPSPSNHHQPDPSNAPTAPSTMNISDEHLSTNQITSPSTPSAHSIATEGHESDDVKAEYDDDEDEGEYMSDCDEECEDCAKGICQSNQSHLVRENDNANKDDTNAHNVTVNIKTESMDNCDLMQVKQEIKEEEGEEDHDILIKQEIKEEDDEADHEADCDRGEVKREMVSDDDDNSMQLDDSANSDEVMQPNLNQPIVISSPSQLTSPTNSVPQCATASANEEVPNSSSVIGESVDQAVIGPNGIDRVAQCTRVVQSSDAQANMDQVINRENVLAYEDQQDFDGDDEQLLNTLNEPNSVTRVTQSADLFSASNSTGQDSIRTDLTQQATVSTQSTELTANEGGGHEESRSLEDAQIGTTSPQLTRQSQANNRKSARLAKRKPELPQYSNEVTNQDAEEDEEDDAGEGTSRKRARPSPSTTSSTDQKQQIITHSLRCPQVDCPDLIANDEFHLHMWKKHSIRRFRCLVKDCKHSFDKQINMSHHLTQSHQSTSQWYCNKCDKHFTSYRLLSDHNMQLHQLGHFQCSFPACAFTGECKQKVYSHYANQHKQTFTCNHVGCPYQTQIASNLKRHQRTHLVIKPYRCKWPECGYASTRSDQTIVHIRRVHFAANSSSVPTGSAQPSQPADYLEVMHELL